MVSWQPLPSCGAFDTDSACVLHTVPQYALGMQQLCVTRTLSQLLDDCDALIAQATTAGGMLFSGTFYTGVTSETSDADSCDDDRVLVRSGAHDFALLTDVNGTGIDCYQLATPDIVPYINAYVNGIWWQGDGEVLLKLVTRVQLSSGAPVLLADARVLLSELQGVVFQFVYSNTPCLNSTNDHATVCTQHWLLRSIDGYDDEDFSGTKPLLFDLFVPHYGAIRLARVDLQLLLHRSWHVDQMVQQLSATLMLARDRHFTQLYLPDDDEEQAPFVHDCDLIYAKLGLCLSDSWSLYYDLVIDRVQLCSAPENTSSLTLYFDPNDPDHSGCNSPNITSQLQHVLLYDRDSDYSNDAFNFSFVANPPALSSSEEAFRWLSRNLGTRRYLLQVRWFAHTMSMTSTQRRALIFTDTVSDSELTYAGAQNTTTATFGSAASVFVVACDDTLHVYVPGHGCLPPHLVTNINTEFPWWFWLLLALVACCLLCLLCMAVLCRRREVDPQYILVADETHHHHHHHHQQAGNNWGVIASASSGKVDMPLLGYDQSNVLIGAPVPSLPLLPPSQQQYNAGLRPLPRSHFTL